MRVLQKILPDIGPKLNFKWTCGNCQIYCWFFLNDDGSTSYCENCDAEFGIWNT